MRLTDLAAGALLCALALFALFVVLPAQTSAAGGIGLGPRDLPTLSLLIVIGLSALLAVQALFGRTRERKTLWPASGHETWTMAVGFSLTLAGIGIFQYAGFLVGGTVLIVSIMWFMGDRSWLRLLLTPTVVVGSMYVFVTQLLHISVP